MTRLFSQWSSSLQEIKHCTLKKCISFLRNISVSSKDIHSINIDFSQMQKLVLNLNDIELVPLAL